MVNKVSVILIGSNIFDEVLLEKVWSIKPFEIIVVLSNEENSEFISAVKSKSCQIVISDGNQDNNGYVSALNKAKGEIILFLDSRLSSISSEEINKFLEPLTNKQADVVLNNLIPNVLKTRNKQWPDPIRLCKEVYNDSLGHNSLYIDTLLSFPHAYSQQVKNKLGIDCFFNLAVAHMQILEHGFKIARPIYVNISSIERQYTREQSHFSVPLTEWEQEHIKLFLEGWGNWFQIHGNRGNYHDSGRRRDLVVDIKKNNNLSKYAKIYEGTGRTSSLYNGKQLSIIIPAQNEEATIAAVLTQARYAEPLEIIVVVNGSTDNTEEIARIFGTTVVVFEEALGIDVGRAFGASIAKGDILLFIDADFPIPSYDLQQFALAVSNGVDVALNKLNFEDFPLYVVNQYKYLLNIICKRKDLGVGSVVAIPHAISKSCLNGIGWYTLMNPNIAHVKAILQGYTISNVHFVDVMSPNKIRPDQHFSSSGHPKAVLRINGDHLEAIAYLLDNSIN
ncbi:glycosyl transferase [Bacillus sp. Y1]|nr:glycosyltransferase [Bacillus sp. Y1]AYA75679.1 glycosyl transferase [Bacillus sp. Y1]